MKRLTARNPINNMAYLVKVKQDEQDVESPYPNTLKAITESFKCLAEYEETGFSPKEVEKLKQQRDIYKENWIKQLNAMLAEFDKDGWCRLVMKKEDVLQMKKEMENDYGIFND